MAVLLLIFATVLAIQVAAAQDVTKASLMILFLRLSCIEMAKKFALSVNRAAKCHFAKGERQCIATNACSMKAYSYYNNIIMHIVYELQ